MTTNNTWAGMWLGQALAFTTAEKCHKSSLTFKEGTNRLKTKLIPFLHDTDKLF